MVSSTFACCCQLFPFGIGGTKEGVGRHSLSVVSLLNSFFFVAELVMMYHHHCQQWDVVCGLFTTYSLTDWGRQCRFYITGGGYIYEGLLGKQTSNEFDRRCYQSIHLQIYQSQVLANQVLAIADVIFILFRIALVILPADCCGLVHVLAMLNVKQVIWYYQRNYE